MQSPCGPRILFLAVHETAHADAAVVECLSRPAVTFFRRTFPDAGLDRGEGGRVGRRRAAGGGLLLLRRATRRRRGRRRGGTCGVGERVFAVKCYPRGGTRFRFVPYRAARACRVGA